MTVLTATISESFHQIYPDASVGVLVINQIKNPDDLSDLNAKKLEIENNLRERYSEKADLRNNATILSYEAYYKQFNKRYVVCAQLESVIFKGRSIPTINPLVQAMFMSELDNMLLTAGHDLSSIDQPVVIGLGEVDMSYTLINGNDQTVKENDMLMNDQKGIISTVVYGPDKRTQIGSSTQDAIFVTYTPAGIAHTQIEKHFADISSYVKLFAPDSIVTMSEIF
jgi:DNA/RNA-binding domain of Phe-tRNA-synthetase-like protein